MKFPSLFDYAGTSESSPARGTWVEIGAGYGSRTRLKVVSRTGDVG